MLIHLKEHKFVIQVKHSTRGLTRFAKAIVAQQPMVEEHHTFEKQHGRWETRHVKVYQVPQSLREEYPLHRVILVKRRRMFINTMGKLEVSYYVSNIDSNHANTFYQLIRQHWWVENKVHWVKDVICREDTTKFHNYDSFKKNALYRNVLISAIRQAGWASVKAALEWLANQPAQIARLLGINFRT